MKTAVRARLDEVQAKPKPVPAEKTYHRWTLSELKLLADRTLDAAQLAVKLGVSRSAVYSQRRMQRLGAVLLFAAVGWGQTTIAPSQLRAGMPGETEKIRLFAVSLSGMVQVQVGPGLRLVLVGGVPTLQAAPVKRVRRMLKPNSGGHYECEAACEIYRNGFLMLEGWDYTHNGAGVIPAGPWSADDTVVCATFAEAVPP